MKDKIKKFIDCYISVTTCNLKCHYCYIAQSGAFRNELPKFEYTPEQVGAAFSKKRWGGVCCINLCGGGETLFPAEMPLYIKAILEQGHYVMVVTNGTLTNRFRQITKIIPAEHLKRLFFKFSFHFLELKRTNQMDVFFNNIRLVKDAGCSYTVEITPNDELIPYIDEIKEISLKNVGALPHITIARDSTKPEFPILTKLSEDEYNKVWSTFNSDMFKYKLSVFNKKRTEYCYAGVWSYFLGFDKGELKACYSSKIIQNIFKNVKSPIRIAPIGKNCPEAHCFNSHAWLTFGDIPELEAPTFLKMRNRVTVNGENWCQEPIKSFFNSKLSESNKEFNNFQKFIYKLMYSPLLKWIFYNKKR